MSGTIQDNLAIGLAPQKDHYLHSNGEKCWKEVEKTLTTYSNHPGHLSYSLATTQNTLATALTPQKIIIYIQIFKNVESEKHLSNSLATALTPQKIIIYIQIFKNVESEKHLSNSLATTLVPQKIIIYIQMVKNVEKKWETP